MVELVLVLRRGEPVAVDIEPYAPERLRRVTVVDARDRADQLAARAAAQREGENSLSPLVLERPVGRNVLGPLGEALDTDVAANAMRAGHGADAYAPASGRAFDGQRRYLGGAAACGRVSFRPVRRHLRPHRPTLPRPPSSAPAPFSWADS